MWIERFLSELEKRGSISAAAMAVGVGRRTVYDERARNPEFNELMCEMALRHVEEVEATLYQRAVSGASDTAIIFFLKTHKPERYGDKLGAEQLEDVRRRAQREQMEELHAEIHRLPQAAREALLTAFAAIPEQAAQGSSGTTVAETRSR